jgi:hypothetical protein
MTFEEWWSINYSTNASMSSQELATYAFAKETARMAWQATQPQWQLIETALMIETSFYACDFMGRYYIGSIIEGEFYMSNGKKPYIAPTHWMPLPQPPELK